MVGSRVKVHNTKYVSQDAIMKVTILYVGLFDVLRPHCSQGPSYWDPNVLNRLLVWLS